MIAKKSRFHSTFGLIIFSSCSTFLIFFILILLLFAQKENAVKNKIYPHVFIDAVDFGMRSKNEVALTYLGKNEKLKNTVITIQYDNLPIATFSGQRLKIHFDAKGIAQRAYLIGRSTNFSSRIYQKFAAIVGLQRFYFDTPIEYDTSVVEEFIANQEEKYNHPAKNALFAFENGKVTSFRQEEKGLKLESDKLRSDFESTIRNLKKKTESKIITLSSKIIEPEITLSKANNLGIEELIAVGKSDFTHSIPERIHNVTLAASKFNGVLIPKDKIFSFNDTAGDISQLTGYKQAYIIKNGKTVLGDGGGVCQVSTTLFRAALNAGLPIIERTAHAYRVGYYENDSKPGFDATVFAPSVDFKIKNDTPAAILIQTEIDKDKNLLYFRFYGKKDGRNVEISSPVIYDVEPSPPPVNQDDPTLKKGVTKQIDFAASGAKVNFNYKVTRANDVLFEKKFFSIYRPWQAVYLVGQAD